MPIHNPPFYRYSLHYPWQTTVFTLIKKLAKEKTYPTLQGTHDDKNQFIITLIRTQKALHDWEVMLVEVITEIQKTGTINTTFFNKKYPPESISKDTPDWVTYEGDKIVSDFIDKLETRKIDFVGSDVELSEFILRFILGQLGHDWEQTIMMIWEMLGDENSISVKELNDEMKHFDYVGLFH